MTMSHPVYGENKVQVEIVEVERKGDLSRIHIVRTTGIDYNVDRMIPAWIEQDRIHWFTEGSA